MLKKTKLEIYRKKSSERKEKIYRSINSTLKGLYKRCEDKSKG